MLPIIPSSSPPKVQKRHFPVPVQPTATEENRIVIQMIEQNAIQNSMS
jgi:hypothetical protein